MSYKVLTLMKPGDEQIAMERVNEFARFMPDLEVTALRVINDFNEANRDQLEANAIRELDHIMARYPSVKQYATKVVFNKDVAKAFCDFAKNYIQHFDLAVISANKRNTLKDLFVSTIDSQIMRKICIPLLIVKDPHAPQRLGKAILLAIDFEEKEHDKKIDEILFTSANIFAQHFNGEVHVLNCVPHITRGLMGANISSSIVLGNMQTISRSDIHAQSLFNFADQHDLPHERCHIAEGRVDEMVPRVCTKLEARMVCMGMSAKDGVLSAIDQSASELVLEQIHGDIFIVNEHVHFTREQIETYSKTEISE